MSYIYDYPFAENDFANLYNTQIGFILFDLRTQCIRNDIKVFFVPAQEFLGHESSFSWQGLEYMKQKELSAPAHRNNPALYVKDEKLMMWKPCDFDGFPDERIEIPTVSYKKWRDWNDVEHISPEGVPIERHNFVIVVLISERPSSATNWPNSYQLPDKNGWHAEYWAEFLYVKSDKAKKIDFKTY